ncbi:MAG: fibronectin type III domain-containing protein, partial [Bacteroidales bacterium]|nr:fibronectin type III domain-containing protein [Bacteroidales bacterium]
MKNTNEMNEFVNRNSLVEGQSKETLHSRLSTFNSRLSTLVLIVCCLFFSATAWGQSSTLDVYSSATSTNEYVPFYGYYADATQRNQMIYPSSELSSMVGKEITKMEFYISSVSGSGNIGDWIVSLGETAATSLTGLDNSTTLTEVYSGAMTFVSNNTMMTVTFTNGYVYNGGNLLVEFNHPNTAGYKHYYFTGQSVTGASYCYSAQRNFLPKVTFTYQNPPSCAKPTGLTATLTPGNGTIADLSWTENGTATNWVVEYATNSSFTGAQTKNVSGTSSTQLTGLTAETAYYARVKANCGGGDESDWSSTCEFLPTNSYSITLNDGSTTNGFVPIYGFYVDQYTKSQFIIPSTDLSAIQYGTITKLTFYSSNDNINWGSALFEVYMTELGETTLSSIADWSSLDKVMNAASLEISGGQMSVTLDAPYQYMGGNLMIGFLQTNTGSYVSCSWYGVSATGASMGGYGNLVDNNSSVSQQNFLPKTTIEYTPGVAPTCPKPRDLTFVSATATTATISWTAGASETQWQYSIDGGVNWTLVSTTSATLSNLTSNTQYTVLVRAYCSSSDQSGTISETFTTELCDPEDMCEISIELTDAYGDGGGSIQVINSSTSDVLGSYTLDDDSETYTLSVCNGAPLSFVYASTDSWPYENGFVITDPNGDVIVEHVGCSSSGDCSAPSNGEVASYTMSCSTCRKPT